jgi:uncharacterized iron-regulated protein
MVVVLGMEAVALASQSQPVYVPERVYDTRLNAFADFESMLAALSAVDVVFVGEQHDDPNTHRLEAAILDGLRRRGSTLVVSLEMFERDVQPLLDAYLAGQIPEGEFLKAARPWPRYESDYRPLVELAKTHGWPVVAANVPRRMASDVSRSGIGTLDGLPSADRVHAARDLNCPHDAYFDRFAAAMNSHPAPGADKLSATERRDLTERYYMSQCVKDETMAESIAASFERATSGGRRGTVVHFNGAFHSDFGTGTVERTRRRLSERRVAVVSVLPVSDLDALAPSADDLKRADYLVFTVK